MFKTIIVAALFGTVLGLSVGFAGATATPTVNSRNADKVTIPENDKAIEVTLDDNGRTLPTTVIVGGASKKIAQNSPAKTWGCGNAHTMRQGPIGATVKECGWR